jgi:hypothetical protein
MTLIDTKLGDDRDGRSAIISGNGTKKLDRNVQVIFNHIDQVFLYLDIT